MRTLAIPLVVLASLAPGAGAESVPWDDLLQREQDVVERYLAAPDWPIRAFGLMRLERYEGDAVAEMLATRGLRAEAWPVRVFAIRQAQRMGIAIDPADFAEESEPHVIRALLQRGVPLPTEQVEQVAARLLRTKTVDALVLGLQIAAASEAPKARKQAAQRVDIVIRNMDPPTAALIGPRLAQLLAIDPAPTSLREWQSWYLSSGGVTLPPPERARVAAGGPAPLVATMEYEPFNRLWDYLDVLRQRDLDLAIVMDSTASMLPMINEARVGVDSMILFFNDVSRRMRLAFVAYRDHDNPPVWEGHPFTDQIGTIREFLFGIRITGGNDLPEAVLDGMKACRQLDWNPRAMRQLILVGDARPHDEDMYDTLELAEWYVRNGVTVNAVHVPQQIVGTRRPEYAARVRDHTERTDRAFRDIAEAGGGQMVTLDAAEQLVPAVMHITIEEGWWPVFDEFYGLYRELCR